MRYRDFYYNFSKW